MTDSPTLKRLREENPGYVWLMDKVAPAMRVAIEDAITAIDNQISAYAAQLKTTGDQLYREQKEHKAENEALRAQLAEVDLAFIDSIQFGIGSLHGKDLETYKSAVARELARRSEREAPEVK